MNRYVPDSKDDFYPVEPTGNEDDLWFLPGPVEGEPDDRPRDRRQSRVTLDISIDLAKLAKLAS